MMDETKFHNPCSESFNVIWRAETHSEAKIFCFMSYHIKSFLLGEHSWFQCMSDSTSLTMSIRCPRAKKKQYSIKVCLLDSKGSPCYVQKSITTERCISQIWNLEKNLIMKDYNNFLVDNKLSFYVSITDTNIINMDQYELKDEMIQTSRQKDDVQCLDSLSTDFFKLLVSGADHDVIVNTGSWQFPSHKAVLSSRSEFFSAMFKSNMRESKVDVVYIEDIPPLHMEQFFKYIYSGKVDNLTEESALRLYEIASKYAVESLKKKCSEYLVEILTPENACRCLLLANAHNDLAFKISSMNFIIQNEEMLKTREWAAISIQHPNLGVEVLQAHFHALNKQTLS